jgi:hypothetical protein
VSFVVVVVVVVVSTHARTRRSFGRPCVVCLHASVCVLWLRTARCRRCNPRRRGRC